MNKIKQYRSELDLATSLAADAPSRAKKYEIWFFRDEQRREFFEKIKLIRKILKISKFKHINLIF